MCSSDLGQAPPPKPPAIIDTPAPPVDDALAALMATPEYQAQMAALTQQATASLKTLVSGLAEAGGQLSAPSEKLAPPIIDIPYGLAVEPMFLPWSSVPPGPDGSPVLVGPPVFRMALEPSPEELAVDMLSALPQAAAVTAIAAPPLPAASAIDDTPMLPAFFADHRAGGENGTG